MSDAHTEANGCAASGRQREKLEELSRDLGLADQPAVDPIS